MAQVYQRGAFAPWSRGDKIIGEKAATAPTKMRHISFPLLAITLGASLGVGWIVLIPMALAQPSERRGYLVHDLVDFFNQNQLGGLHPRQIAGQLAGFNRGEDGEGIQSTVVSMQVRTPARWF
ncbi:MAG: hypothetical protein HC919_05975 [Oscillatoriales cyanobacterium SM2_2_1]|nr:hypothetical protein [Oscillatoriales cyanobacterium SM2_2_1]